MCLNHLIYADDTVLIAPSATALQQLLNICQDFVKENDLELNPSKSKYMVFKTDIIKGLQCPDVYINETLITRVANVKYLGVHICDDLSDDMAIANCVQGTYTRGNIIKRNFSCCTQDVKLKLFQSYCSSFYCCSLWHHFKKESYRKLKVSYNNVFRIVCGGLSRKDSISRFFVSLNIPHCDVLRRKLVLGMYKRVMSSSNHLIYTLIDSTFFVNSSLFKSWRSILYK